MWIFEESYIVFLADALPQRYNVYTAHPLKLGLSVISA